MYGNERVDQARIRNVGRCQNHEIEEPLPDKKDYFPEERGDVRSNPKNTIKRRSAKIVENLDKIRQESLVNTNAIKPASNAIKTLNKLTEDLKEIRASAPENVFEAKAAITAVKNSFWRRGWENFKAFFANIVGKRTQYQSISALVITYESKLHPVVTKMTQLLGENYDTSSIIDGEKIEMQSSLKDIILVMSQEFQRIKEHLKEYDNPHDMLTTRLDDSIMMSQEFYDAIILHSEKYDTLHNETRANNEELASALKAIELLDQVKNLVDTEFVVQQLHLQEGSYSKDQVTNRALKAIMEKGNVEVLNTLIKNSEEDIAEDALATAVVFENASVAIKAVSEPVQMLGIHGDINKVISKESGVMLISHFNRTTRKEEIEVYFNDGDGGMLEWIQRSKMNPTNRVPVAIVNDITAAESQQNEYKCLVGVNAARYLEQKIYG